jgi:hypothetical protein
MQLVQFVDPLAGRSVGVIRGTDVVNLTSADRAVSRVYDLVQRAFSEQTSLARIVSALETSAAVTRLCYSDLLITSPNNSQPYLVAPFDHPDPARLMISGTGLTHLGSVQSRDQMHGGQQEAAPQTDSARMFAMGIEGGRPASGARGVSPEWFYKGNGNSLRGPQASLEIPEFALDGGEEPEIAGCYVIDPAGNPRRVGFVLGNEWSDHATEKINYLYLAPSKLRECAVGPSLQVTDDFAAVQLRCTVTRNGQTIYDSGELFSGEEHMCHSLRNMEDHHFKYDSHRQPGEAHLHFFGTSRLSFSTRTWKYQTGDVIRIEAPGFCEPLVNSVRITNAAIPDVVNQVASV